MSTLALIHPQVHHETATTAASTAVAAPPADVGSRVATPELVALVLVVIMMAFAMSAIRLVWRVFEPVFGILSRAALVVLLGIVALAALLMSLVR